MRPAAIDHSWNDGRPIAGRTADDVAFISALIDELRARYAVSPVYVAGMSNGGFMAFTLACRLSTKIAGIASVAGSMGSLDGCTPARAIPC